jgi:hypothetical protein
MHEEAQTFGIDPKNPGYELVRRILRLLVAPWLVAVAILFVTGAVQTVPALMLVAVAVISFAVIPGALRRFPGQVTIAPVGLTAAAKRGRITIPWADIYLIELRSGGDQNFIYDLLRLDPAREFVYVGIRADSETRQKARSLNDLSLCLKDNRLFVDAANKLRGAS